MQETRLPTGSNGALKDTHMNDKELLQMNDGSETALHEVLNGLSYSKSRGNYTLWESIMRCFWMLVGFVALVLLLKLMAWADTGMRQLEDNTQDPSQRVHEINYK